MDLFLETPQQQAERMLRQQQRLMEMQMQGAAHKLIISFSVTSMRRLNAGAQGGETFASRDPAKP